MVKQHNLQIKTKLTLYFSTQSYPNQLYPCLYHSQDIKLNKNETKSIIKHMITYTLLFIEIFYIKNKIVILLFQFQSMDMNHFMQMMLAGGTLPKNTKHTKIIVQDCFPANQQEFNQYSHQIKSIYHQIFCDVGDTEQNQKKNIQLQRKLQFQIVQTPMPICNKILNQRETVFRCYDCMTHEASVLCKECFEKGNHKGHRYNQIQSGGGNCDCGNPDAVKQSGFCTDHPGKADPVIIDEKQQNHFLQITLTIFQWIFRLYENKMAKSSDILGQAFSDFLIHFNQKSLYYNTLTYKMLYSKRRYGRTEKQRKQKIIDTVFKYGIKCVNFAKKLTQIFFNMFSLQVFKYQLTVSFSQAYNTVQNFQKSRFKSLYIQLFANNDIVQKLITQSKIVLYPCNRRYDYHEYIQNLMFISSIKPQIASKFFQLLMQKGIIKLPELDQIQEKVQKGTSHIIQITNQNLNNQNFYYTLHESIIVLLKDKPQSIIGMLNKYSEAIMDVKYSYSKNRLVMPFHKVFALIILAINQGSIQDINFEQIQKYLIGQHSLKQIFQRVFKLILQCFWQFARTFFQPTYFDNYLPLYVKSGNTIVLNDMLMLNICIKFFRQTKNYSEMNKMLNSIFQLQQKHNMLSSKKYLKQGKPQNQMDLEHSDNEWVDLEQDQKQVDRQLKGQENTQGDPQQFLNLLKRNVQLAKIIIETCISDRAEVSLLNSLKIHNPECKYKTERLFVQILNNFKQISPENLKIIQKNFIGATDEQQMLKKFLTFDKNKKKYTLNQTQNSNHTQKKVPLQLYKTMMKLGGILAVEEKEINESQLQNAALSKYSTQRLKAIFNDEFFGGLARLYVGCMLNGKNCQDKQIRKVFLEFFELANTLRLIMLQEAPLAVGQFFARISQLSQKQQYKFLTEKLLNKNVQDDKQHDKQNLMKKFNEKKKKKLEEMKKKQNAFSGLMNQNKMEEQQNQTKCIICHQEGNSGISYLASFNYSNILQAINNAEGRSLVFNSCFHPIHIQCFIKVSKGTEGYLPCPLCKSQSNIILPLQKQVSNLKTMKQIYERLINLRATFAQIYKGFDLKYEQFGILSIFRSFSSIIGKNLLKNQPILNHKDQRISNTLYSLAQTIYKRAFITSQAQKQLKIVEQFIVCLKSKIKSYKPQTTNFYAFQYFVLKILYNCFDQKSFLCTQVLKQPQILLLNRQDLRKVWQMCDQIVSLPSFKTIQEQNKFSLKQMHNKVDFYIPPPTVYDLILIRDQPQMSCKTGHQMCICIICNTKGCYDCKQMTNHLKKVHCGQGVAFNLLTGGLVYMWQGKIVHIPSFYMNDLGISWKPSKSAQGFNLDKQNFDQLKSQILNQTILKYINQKYPLALKNSLFNQFF